MQPNYKYQKEKIKRFSYFNSKNQWDGGYEIQRKNKPSEKYLKRELAYNYNLSVRYLNSQLALRNRCIEEVKQNGNHFSLPEDHHGCNGNVKKIVKRCQKFVMEL